MKQAKKYTYDETYDAARTALSAMYDIARDNIRKNWKTATRKQRYDAMRGLVVIRHVARDPQKYLSRAQTEIAWQQRAVEYAREKDLPHVMHAYYIVQTPELLVVNAAENALNAPFGKGGLRNEFYCLTEGIREYDYRMTSRDLGEKGLAPKYAKNIATSAARLSDIADETRAKGLRRKMLAFYHSLKNYEK